MRAPLSRQHAPGEGRHIIDVLDEGPSVRLADPSPDVDKSAIKGSRA